MATISDWIRIHKGLQVHIWFGYSLAATATGCHAIAETGLSIGPRSEQGYSCQEMSGRFGYLNRPLTQIAVQWAINRHRDAETKVYRKDL